MFAKASRIKESRLLPPSQSFEISETDSQGAGTISFQSNVDVWQLVNCDANHAPWLTERKHADGAFIYKNGRTVVIHVVELKNTITSSTWQKSIKQFEGIVLDSLSVLGVLGTNWKIKIKVYSAYKTDNLSASSSVSPTMLKTQLGTGSPVSPDSGWFRNSADVLDFKDVPLQKIVRDPAGNATVNLQLP